MDYSLLSTTNFNLEVHASLQLLLVMCSEILRMSCISGWISEGVYVSLKSQISLLPLNEGFEQQNSNLGQWMLGIIL